MADKRFEKLMYELQMYGFVLDEARLFLDTHPTNKEALAYYDKYSALYDDTKREFERVYGPLTANKSAVGDTWRWIDGGWPWMGSYEEE